MFIRESERWAVSLRRCKRGDTHVSIQVQLQIQACTRLILGSLCTGQGSRASVKAGDRHRGWLRLHLSAAARHSSRKASISKTRQAIWLHHRPEELNGISSYCPSRALKVVRIGKATRADSSRSSFGLTSYITTLCRPGSAMPVPRTAERQRPGRPDRHPSRPVICSFLRQRVVLSSRPRFNSEASCAP